MSKKYKSATQRKLNKSDVAGLKKTCMEKIKFSPIAMKQNQLKIFFMIGICVMNLDTYAQNFQLIKDINTSKDGSPANYINI